MKRDLPLTDTQIMDRVLAGKCFRVTTNKERKQVLAASKFAGKKLVTRWSPAYGQFEVFFFGNKLNTKSK